MRPASRFSARCRVLAGAAAPAKSASSARLPAASAPTRASAPAGSAARLSANSPAASCRPPRSHLLSRLRGSWAMGGARQGGVGLGLVLQLERM